jgi:hypothetical protein
MSALFACAWDAVRNIPGTLAQHPQQPHQNLLVDHSDRAVTSGAFPRKRPPLAMCGAWQDAAGWCAPG